MQFKVIFTSFIGRYKSGSPPDLMGETFFVHNLLPSARPFFISAQNAGLKGIAVMNKHLFYVISGLQVYNKFIFIPGIAHLF